MHPLAVQALERYQAAMSLETPTHLHDNAKSTVWRTEFLATLSLAWPLILTNISQILINTTDVLMLGRVGPAALGASAVGTGFVWTAMLFGIGLITASSPMMASALGHRFNAVRDVRRTFRQSLWTVAIITVAIWGILWFSGPLMLLAGQPQRLSDDVGQFVRALQWMVLPGLGIVAIRTFLAAVERPGWTLAIGLGGTLVNGIINYGLIFGNLGLPQLGLVGAGIGSSISTSLTFIALVILIARHPKFRRFHLFGRFWRPDWPRFAQIWRLGLPIAMTMGFEASVFTLAVFLMGYINTASVAAHAIAIQIASMTFQVPLGLAQAVTVRVGLAYGRKDAEGINRAGWAAFALGVSFMTLMAAIIWLIPSTLASLYVDPTLAANGPVIDLAVTFLLVAAVFQIVDGAQVVGAGMLRGLHDTKVPMQYAAFGYWIVGIGVGTGLAFLAGWQGLGIWVGLAAGLGVVSLLMLRRWMARERLGLLP
jgi:multidrug resistance protein, MATE family